MKILIANHDKEFLDAASEKLIARGFSVKKVISENDAINNLKEEKFDALFCEINAATGRGMKILKYVDTLKEKPILLPMDF